MLRAFAPLLVCLSTLPLATALRADNAPPSAAGPLLNLLQRGTLPPERTGAVAKMVSERGNEHDLAFLLQQAIADDWPIQLRSDVLGWLKEAAATRKVKPAGDLSGLTGLLAADQPVEIRRVAVDLAGEWEVAAAGESLQQIALSSDESRELRTAAIRALSKLGRDTALPTIEKLLKPDVDESTRIMALVALTELDPQRAATTAARVLSQADTDADPAPVMDAFLNQQGGAERLAAALEKEPPSREMALLALRHLYAVGRSDPALDKLLSKLAGMDAEVPQLTPEQMTELGELALKQGDPARGEAVFRRNDLACLRCHAVSKAGGQVGPDLSAVGVSSPAEYLVKSLYDPDAQKKEEYLTRIVVTIDGLQVTGIVEDRTDDKITLKTAEGKRVEIATADIDFEAEGRSLMPDGLVKFMTQQEVLDLVSFLSQLGRPGTPYEIRSTPRFQRYRALMNPPEPVLNDIPNVELFGDIVLNATTWQSAYARVDGSLPLPELVAQTGHEVIYVQGEVDVTAAGPVTLELDSPEGVTLWVNEESISSLTPPLTIDLDRGRHAITLRIDTTRRTSDSLTMQLARPAGSSAQFTVVDGQ